MVIFRCEELAADHYGNSDVTTNDSTDIGSPQWIPQGFPTFRHIPFKVCVCACVCVCVCVCVYTYVRVYVLYGVAAVQHVIHTGSFGAVWG